MILYLPRCQKRVYSRCLKESSEKTKLDPRLSSLKHGGLSWMERNIPDWVDQNSIQRYEGIIKSFFYYDSLWTGLWGLKIYINSFHNGSDMSRRAELFRSFRPGWKIFHNLHELRRWITPWNLSTSLMAIHVLFLRASLVDCHTVHFPLFMYTELAFLFFIPRLSTCIFTRAWPTMNINHKRVVRPP